MTDVCPICPPDRQRVPRRPQVCDGDRSRLYHNLVEVPELVAELKVRELVVDEAPRRRGVDVVAELLPAASVPSRRRQRVTGTTERPTPISLSIVDLTDQARAGVVHDEFGDQIGHQSAATILDLWVREVRHHRGRREQLPRPAVDVLTSWLLVRLDDACDTFPAIADFATEVRHLRAALRAQLGLIAYDAELKDGVACPKCDTKVALHQAAGDDRIECAACGVRLSIDEYNAWARLLASQVEWLRHQICDTCGLDRMYRLRATDEPPRCGWCQTTRGEPWLRR